MDRIRKILSALTICATISLSGASAVAETEDSVSTITVHEIDFYDNNSDSTDVRVTSGLLAEHKGVSSISITGSFYSAFVFTFEVGPGPLTVAVERIGQGSFYGNAYWPCFEPACGCFEADCIESADYPLPNTTEEYVLQPGLYRYNLNCGQGGAGLRFTWTDTMNGPALPVAPCCLPSGCAELDEATCASLDGVWLESEGQTCADCPAYCEGDFNGDGEVDGYDLSVLLNAWGFCVDGDGGDGAP